MTKHTTGTAARDMHHPFVPHVLEGVVTTVAAIGGHALDLLPTHELDVLMGGPLELNLEPADFDMETVEQRM